MKEKILKIEKLLIEAGREMNSKAVMFKDDIQNVKNIQNCLENLLVIQKRLATKPTKKGNK